MLCDTFVRVPKRRQEPSYYDVVANPIDLLKVQQKLKTEAYDDIEELTSDFELLVNNAKAFYKPDSVEYQDACTLWEMFTTKAKQLEAGGDLTAETKRPVRARKSVTMDEPTSDPLEIDMELLEDLFSSVMQARDPINEDRYLHSQFQLLPSKKLYPDYYDVIEHPIDLKLIATKIQTSAYTSLTDMEKDLLQMVKNACTFNEPGSQIYKDAKSLKKIFTAKKSDIENGRVRRTLARKEKGYSAKIAALKEEVESSDDEADDLMEAEGNGPIWQLFDQLYNTANLAGAPLGDSLWKLPNRRFHPEYYAVVKKPISMAQIRNKLKKGLYSVITDMTADLYLMLDNAKKAIPPHKPTYKDAVKMQKILNQKLIDNGLDMEDTESEDTTDSTSLQQLNSSTQSSITSTPHNASNLTNLSSPSPAMTSFSGMITTEKKKKGRPRLGTTPTTSGATKVRVPNHALALKKKLLALHRYFLDFTVNNRRPMDLFLEKPSKKLYPDYYKVIHQPIDMQTIEAQIKGDFYATMEEVFSDYRLMFMNCRNYNEEGSVIYEDANILERALNEKIKDFAGMDPRLNKKG
jgi:protein polybromo-1